MIVGLSRQGILTPNTSSTVLWSHLQFSASQSQLGSRLTPRLLPPHRRSKTGVPRPRPVGQILMLQ